MLQFTSQNGRVRICLARENKHPLQFHNGTDEEHNEIYCYETTGNYIPVGSYDKDVQFLVKKPCRGNKREDCHPLYLSVTPISGVNGGSTGLDCQSKKKSSDIVI